MAGSDILSQGTDALQALGNALSYTWGNCTRWVAENLSWIPAGLGNANQWLANAQAKGLPTAGPSSAPMVGSVAVWNTGAFGHVAEVVGVVPGGFQVSEENWLGLDKTDIRTVTGSALQGLEGFILPPNAQRGWQDITGAAGSAAAAAGGALSSAQALAGLPAAVGHGLADATSAASHNLGVFFRNNVIALVVALVVAIVLFGGDDRLGA